jgi:hypothetical protein
MKVLLLFVAHIQIDANQDMFTHWVRDEFSPHCKKNANIQVCTHEYASFRQKIWFGYDLNRIRLSQENASNHTPSVKFPSLFPFALP